MPDAYAYLRARTNLDDADERLRLANWCRLNGLREQRWRRFGRPSICVRTTPRLRRLLQHLQQSEPAPVKRELPLASVNEPQTEQTPPVELTTESLGLFATRVQPILMNTCARCHATGRGGKFRLIQAYEGGLVNRRTLERNLASVLAEINLDRPESSRLLSKAVSDHAHTGQAPLKDRKEAPYRTLESWVKLTVANNPHLRNALPPTAGTKGRTTPAHPMAEPPSSAAEPRTAWGADARPAVRPDSSSPTVPSQAPVPVSRTRGARRLRLRHPDRPTPMIPSCSIDRCIPTRTRPVPENEWDARHQEKYSWPSVLSCLRALPNCIAAGEDGVSDGASKIKQSPYSRGAVAGPGRGDRNAYSGSTE